MRACAMLYGLLARFSMALILNAMPATSSRTRARPSREGAVPPLAFGDSPFRKLAPATLLERFSDTTETKENRSSGPGKDEQ